MQAQKFKADHILENWQPSVGQILEIPYFSGGISAGFPSPALDFENLKIDLNKHLIRNPSATFFGKVKGESLKNAGIDDGDLMVIDRSARPLHNKIVVVFLDGEFTAKRIQKRGEEIWLLPENDAYPPIRVTPDNEFLVWGVVTHVIKSF
jgi:DNA polymerase V